MDNNGLFAGLQAENSQLRNQLKSLQTALTQAQTMAQKENDKNASLRTQLNQVCSMNEHLRAENARLIQQQVNNVSSSSSANPFVSPTLVPQFEASTFWQAMVGISNNTSSTNHNSNGNNNSYNAGAGSDQNQQQRHGHGHRQQAAVVAASVATTTTTALNETAAEDDSKLVGSSRPMKTTKRELRYHCEWPGCAYATAYGGDLNKHRRKHTGERPYQCDQCHAAFGQHSSLSAHKYTHSDLKRFHCPQCEYSTNKSSDWTKHLKTGKHKKSL